MDRMVCSIVVKSKRLMPLSLDGDDMRYAEKHDPDFSKNLLANDEDNPPENGIYIWEGSVVIDSVSEFPITIFNYHGTWRLPTKRENEKIDRQENIF
jgi:hypothetical protein